MTHRALVVGETLVDEFPDRRVPAGAPLHVAAHLASLGWAVSLLTRVGDDPDGRWIRDTAESHGIETSLVETDAEIPTGTTTIAINDGDHSFRVNGPAAWEALQGPADLPAHDVLVVGTLPLRAEPSRTTVTRLLSDADTRIAVDLNVRPPEFERSNLGLLLQTAWLLKVNDAEAALTAEVMGSPYERLKTLARVVPAVLWIWTTPIMFVIHRRWEGRC